MIHVMERLGATVLNRMVPEATAAAGPCGCDPGYTWCQSAAVECKCLSDCVTVVCYCPVGGCRK